MLMLKTLVDGHKNITVALGLCNLPGVRQTAPLGFRNTHNFMIGKSLSQTRIDTFI